MLLGPDTQSRIPDRTTFDASVHPLPTENMAAIDCGTVYSLAVACPAQCRRKSVLYRSFPASTPAAQQARSAKPVPRGNNNIRAPAWFRQIEHCGPALVWPLANNVSGWLVITHPDFARSVPRN